MKKIIVLVIAVIAILISTTGCINRATAIVSPGVDIGKVKSFYIVEEQGDKGTWNVYKLIEADLVKRGYAVTTGSDIKPLSKTDVILVYEDKWMWDITMYMLSLTITFKEPTSNLTMASGNSYHTSLTRKSPEEMVNEVLTNIFKTNPTGKEEIHE